MHTLDEMWCPECHTQSKHPWHQCPKMSEEKRAEVLQKHQYLNLYDDMLARGRFQRHRSRGNSETLITSASDSDGCSGRDSPCGVPDLCSSRSPPRSRPAPAVWRRESRLVLP
jgi:hypothetical protein